MAVYTVFPGVSAHLRVSAHPHFSMILWFTYTCTCICVRRTNGFKHPPPFFGQQFQAPIGAYSREYCMCMSLRNTNSHCLQLCRLHGAWHVQVRLGWSVLLCHLHSQRGPAVLRIGGGSVVSTDGHGYTSIWLIKHVVLLLHTKYRVVTLFDFELMDHLPLHHFGGGKSEH